MEKKVGLFAIIVVCLGMLVYLTVTGTPERLYPPPLPAPAEQRTGAAPGEEVKAPDFTLESLQGERHSLSDFRGKPVILNFWSPTCPPCLMQMPSFQKLQEAISEQNLQIILVTPANKAMARDIKEKFDIAVPVLLDKNGQVEKLYQVRSHPLTFVLAPDGTVRKVVPGPYDWAHESVVAYLKKLAGQKTGEQN